MRVSVAEWDDGWVIANYDKLTYEGMAEHFGVTAKQMEGRCSYIRTRCGVHLSDKRRFNGAKKTPKHSPTKTGRWSLKATKLLLDNWEGNTLQELSEVCKKTVRQVMSKAVVERGKGVVLSYKEGERGAAVDPLKESMEYAPSWDAYRAQELLSKPMRDWS